MRKLTIICSVLLMFAGTANAQVLFKFGKYPVETKEFLRVYEKNAINQKPDYSEKALREYIDLYSLFRMKVKEAELMKLDTTKSIQYELDNYRKQLAQNYLTDEEVRGKLVKEAYDRLKENVHVAHILLQSSPMAQSKDTVEPYQLIDSIYKAVVKNGASWDKLAAKYSQDRGSKDNGGDIGYITALQTVYDFENAAFNTPVGKVSKPFRSPYGYHIIKVLDRKPSEGDVEVAQIMTYAPETKGVEGEKAAKAKAEEVLAKLKKGADWSEMVKEYSEDKFSIDKDGKLDRFGIGKMVPAFEEAAYSLKKPGDIYKAPVKTNYGYHVIKLVKKYPLPPFDSMKANLKGRVQRDGRSEVARKIFYQNIKKKNGYREYPQNIEELKMEFVANVKDTGANANKLYAKDFKNDEVLFEIKGTSYKSSDLLSYAVDVTRGRIMGPKEVIFKNLLENYSNMVLTDVEEQNLIDEKPEFRNLMNEYRDGIMLFELMDKKVWGKASKDTAGLKEFHASRKGNYMWNPGFRGGVYTLKTMDDVKALEKLLKKDGTTDEKVLKTLNTDNNPDAVIVRRGFYEYNKFDAVPKSYLKKGALSEPKQNSDGTYTVVFADEMYDTKHPKTLDEARGYAIAEYQDHLEAEWNAKLRSKYPVKINEDVLKSIVK